MKTVRVWDLFVRCFHWSLVAAVIIQLATAEDFKRVHVKVGYFIIALLISRFIWGLIGSRHARFTDFVYPPGEILSYFKGLLRGQPRRYTGHNPAGGAMVCVLLFFLLLTTLSGLLTHRAYGTSLAALQAVPAVARAWADDNGPGDDDGHSGRDSYTAGQAGRSGHAPDAAQAHFWKEIHETLVGIIIFLVVLHFCGVLASSYLHRENLIKAMITGNKKVS